MQDFNKLVSLQPFMLHVVPLEQVSGLGCTEEQTFRALYICNEIRIHLLKSVSFGFAEKQRNYRSPNKSGIARYQMSPINPFYCICAECFKYHITSSKRGPGLASRLFAIKPQKIKFLIRKQNVFFGTECQTVLYFCTVADTFYTLELSGRRDTFLSLREVYYYYIYRLG